VAVAVVVKLELELQLVGLVAVELVAAQEVPDHLHLLLV
jgi:hypothetical protein